MKAINHQKDNYTFVSIYDSSVMNGTIEMTREEFNDAIEFLRIQKLISEKKVDTYTRDALSHVFNWTLKHYGQADRLCLGVRATELIFKHYALPRYKRQNYVIQII